MNLNTTTKLLGVAVFSIAAVLCCVAWWRQGRTWSAWGWLCAAHVVMAIEVLASTRHAASGALRSLLRSVDLYQDRAEVQASVVAALVLGGVLITGLVLARRLGVSRATAVAILATDLALLIFMVEAVSLHGVDGMLYHPAGQVFLIGWLWAALAGLTAWAAVLQGRTDRP